MPRSAEIVADCLGFSISTTSLSMNGLRSASSRRPCLPLRQSLCALFGFFIVVRLRRHRGRLKRVERIACGSGVGLDGNIGRY